MDYKPAALSGILATIHQSAAGHGEQPAVTIEQLIDFAVQYQRQSSFVEAAMIIVSRLPKAERYDALQIVQNFAGEEEEPMHKEIYTALCNAVPFIPLEKRCEAYLEILGAVWEDDIEASAFTGAMATLDFVLLERRPAAAVKLYEKSYEPDKKIVMEKLLATLEALPPAQRMLAVLESCPEEIRTLLDTTYLGKTPETDGLTRPDSGKSKDLKFFIAAMEP